MKNILDKLTDYNALLLKHGYIIFGNGDEPWSIKWVHKDGYLIQITPNGWLFFDKRHLPMETGPDVESLKNFLEL